MNDALVTFVTTGKLNFGDFAKSVIADIARIALRAEETQIFESILGGIANARGTSIANNYMANGGSSYAASGVSYDIGLLGTHANGAIFNSPSLARYANGIYDTPQFFVTHAKGNVFAEDGPEAVMPLTRGPDGKLGVKAQGGMGGDFNFSFAYYASNDTSA